MLSRTRRAPLLLTASAALLTLYAAAPFAHAQQPRRYVVTDLGAFNVSAVNDSGKAVGSAGNRAVFYSGGVLGDVTPPDSVSAAANDINNSARVVGDAIYCDLVNGNHVNCRTRAFVYEGGTFTVLGTLGGRDSHATSVNDAGQIFGYSDTPGPAPDIPGAQHAFIYKDGVFQDIGAQFGALSSYAFAGNNPGQAAGFAANSGAYVYTGGAFKFFRQDATAHGMNDTGHVVGVFARDDTGAGRAFFYDGATVKDLGTLSAGFRFSRARAVNDSDQIVGESSPSFFFPGSERAFLYEGGAMRDLNDLVAPASGRLLQIATAVNDAGQIACNGKLEGSDHAFLLTPLGAPALATDADSQRALAFDSVTLRRDPFTLQTAHNFSADQRTRVLLLARGVELAPGEDASAVAVRAEDAQRRIFMLPVESVRPLRGFEWLTQIVVRLPDELAGTVRISFTLRGVQSNEATLVVK
jgi:probable HAF family extracellular repeat protein